MKVPVALGLAATLLLPATLPAQTRDQARLIFNASIGYIGSASLWQVTGQPLYDDLGGEVTIDTLTIKRRIASTITLGVRGIYFGGDHLGLFGEAFLLGLGFQDSCARTHTTGSVRNAEVCSSLDQAESAGSAVQVAGGVMYRLSSRKPVSPYARASLGVGVASRSSIFTTGTFPSLEDDGEPVEVDIYTDRGRTKIYLGGSLGAGFTAQLAPGYQLRWEVRDNMVRIPTVAGPTAQDGVPPETTGRLRHLWSMEIGFDVVLERRHGRRY
jgi:hypothetical protein